MTPLPLLPCIVLQSAIKFINLTVPSSAGRIAINIRFLQRMDAPTPQAVAAGAVDDVSETLVQIAIVLLTLPFVEIAIDTDDLDSERPGAPIVTVLVVLRSSSRFCSRFLGFRGAHATVLRRAFSLRAVAATVESGWSCSAGTCSRSCSSP